MIKVFGYGLDCAGKSSLMRLLSTGKFDHDYFPPTKKFRITNINLKKAKLVCWDMPGQKVFRQDWIRGAQASNILLYVLDSADKSRFIEAKEEFWNMLNLYELQNLAVLFLVNKIDLLQDIEEIFEEIEITRIFDLDKLNNREIKIIQTSLPNRKGIDSLISWMEMQVDDLLLVNGITSS